MSTKLTAVDNMDVRYDCCLDAAMSVVEGRWKATILCILYRFGPHRFSELEKQIGEVSSRILSKQLKELESDGMIIREVHPDRKLKVVYSISTKGKSILPALAQLAEWGARYQMMQVILPEGSALPDLDSYPAGAGSIKLAEEDALPGSKDQVTV